MKNPIPIYERASIHEALLKALHDKDLGLCVLPNGLDRLKDLGVVTTRITHDAFAAPQWAIDMFCQLDRNEHWVIRYLASTAVNDPNSIRPAMTVFDLGGAKRLVQYMLATTTCASIALPPVLDSEPF